MTTSKIIVPSKSDIVDIDYRSKRDIPAYVSEIISTHLAIESEDARSAGQLGFMARAMVSTTMPYKDPKNDVFERKNGDLKLRIVAGYEGGIPFGIYPRLLMSWITTEAVRTKSPEIELGDSLSSFLRDVLEVRATGGASGTIRRVTEQMKRLFGALVTAQVSESGENGRVFRLRNVLLVEDADIDESEIAASLQRADAAVDAAGDGDTLWTPQSKHEAGQWRSKVRLTNRFFEECITRPVPIDLRAYRALRNSPMAMDLYAWLTYRMSYLKARSRPIRWESLMYQFGSGFGGGAFTERAKLDFKRSFIANMKKVVLIYPEVKVDVTDVGIVLYPSPTHVSSLPTQGNLPF